MSQTSTFSKFQVSHSVIIVNWGLLLVFDYYMTGSDCILKNNIISSKITFVMVVKYLCKNPSVTSSLDMSEKFRYFQNAEELIATSLSCA